jgi:hypothetical protein
MIPDFQSDILASQFNRSLSAVSTAGACSDQDTVLALLDCYAPMWFLTETEEDCPECHEITGHLLSPGLRDGLRGFYCQSRPEEMNPVAREFRARLSLLAKEEL